MHSNEFTISYPKDSGFTSSRISFFKGEPDLVSLFSGNLSRRFFVTDSTICELSSVKEFISCFDRTDYCASDNTNTVAMYKKDDSMLIVLKAGECFKTMQSVLEIVKAALDNNFDRQAVFTAIGGGVICDMTGFAASIFKRGVKLEFVPTTLLAMVDASLGGKTGCDFEGYKNMTGAFYPASRLYVWSSFVLTLNDREYSSGLAEAIKTALLFSKKLYTVFSKNKDDILARKGDVLDFIITECVKAKARIVEKDFREKGDRALLNYGHTFGHALETVSGLGTISHGEAVAWGISRALASGVKKGITNLMYAEEAINLLTSYGYQTAPLPSCVENTDSTKKKLIECMHKDKKNNSSQIKLILQKNLCTNIIDSAEDSLIETVF